MKYNFKMLKYKQKEYAMQNYNFNRKKNNKVTDFQLHNYLFLAKLNYNLQFICLFGENVFFFRRRDHRDSLFDSPSNEKKIMLNENYNYQ